MSASQALPDPTPPVRTLELAGASVLVFESANVACVAAADHIAAVTRQAVKGRGKAVLGLATGATPVPVYERLVALHEAGELSFADVTTYNLDEYYPIAPTDPRSYRTYMDRHLFSRVDIAPNRAHMLDGTVPESFANAYGAEFDRWLAADGGLDLQLLGIGRNGHIGFNEPSDIPLSTALTLPTRVVPLHPVTVVDAVREFGTEPAVIPRALTLGTASILSARQILILAFGAAKSPAVTAALTAPPTSSLPASMLQLAKGKVTWMVDRKAIEGVG